MTDTETPMDPTRVKHLEFLQATIARMAQHSFAVRTIAVTVVSAIAAFSLEAKKPGVLLAAVAAAAVFWALDAFYLHLERVFRRHYDDVRQGAGASKLDMSPAGMGSASAYAASLISTPNLLLYLGLMALAGAAYCGGAVG